ncbi:hypothetical protein HRW08_21330 [Streptomyces lunaelactis]|nr:hypothetical protein [Streptomyces lunaelactis]
MAHPAGPRLVSTAEICEEFGTRPSRISEWYRDRATSGFPEAKRTEGRKRWFDHDEVAEFFAVVEKARAPRKLPASVLDDDQDKLLTAAEVTALLGYSSPSTIYWYLLNVPGYFPEPDETIDGKKWRLGTIVQWVQSRPGKRRAGTVRTAKALPTVSAEGDPDELLGTAEVAALLGFKSVQTFSSSLYQGNLPELEGPDAKVPGLRGQQLNKWRRERVLTAVKRRGSSPGTDDELLDAEAAAGILGYSSTNSFMSALSRGRLPELEEPDLVEVQTGGGKPQKKWAKKRLERIAAGRAAS